MEFEKLVVLIGQDPGFGEEIKISWKFFLGCLEVLCQMMLPPELVAPGKVIYSLKRVQSAKRFLRNVGVNSVQVA